MDTIDKADNFFRCQNSVGVQESMCTLCLETLVAQNFEALEQAELRHDCSGKAQENVRRKRR
jgi:hypothetical protein